MSFYPLATYRPSSIKHPAREATWGIVIHWTAGHEAGDVQVLRGPNVDVHFYVSKRGGVWQFLPSDSQAWHAFHTANHNCIGIETEGAGEAWTPAQFAAVVKLAAWLAKLYTIPVVHVDPIRSHPDGTMPPPADWHGFMGHRDLMGIDGNDHSDTVPPGTGWGVFLAAVEKELKGGAMPTPPWTAYSDGKAIGSGRFFPPSVGFIRKLVAVGKTGAKITLIYNK